jgi:hypothetical protein
MRTHSSLIRAAVIVLALLGFFVAGLLVRAATQLDAARPAASTAGGVALAAPLVLGPFVVALGVP